MKTQKNAEELWLAVKNDIELEILKGTYRAGERIPTLVELVEKYGIGRVTAQKVINSLADDGIIVKQVSQGCFVKPYVKDKIFEKRKKRLQLQLEAQAHEAQALGFAKEQFLQIASDVYD